MGDDDVPFLRAIGYTLGALPLAVLLHVLLAFPSGRLIGTPTRVTAILGYAVAIGLELPRFLVSSDAEFVIWTVQGVLGFALLVVAFVLAARRLLSAPGDASRAGPVPGLWLRRPGDHRRDERRPARARTRPRRPCS